MIGVLIQVRLGSSRLKRKALLPLAGRSVIEHSMVALRAVEADLFALVTDHVSAPQLQQAADGCGYRLFAGDAEDVLQRYIDAATSFGVRTIIRSCGDNPAVSGPLAQSLLAAHRASGAALSGYDDLPLGCGVEIVERDALETARDRSDDPYDHEHVTAFFYRHRDQFDVWRKPAPAAYRAPQVRVTLDTERDYQLLSELYAARYRGNPLAVEEIIDWWHTSVAAREAAR
ncbi:MAG: acylneuraminate cytidylyltransferase [Spirochaetaceae bacterium]|nr:MAG: acylneuraminate cytidylyltransferase [Spirochaetaceae bacterium]